MTLKAKVESKLSKLMNAREAASILNVSISHIYDLVKSGDLPWVRIGGSVRIAPEQLEKFIQANTRK